MIKDMAVRAQLLGQAEAEMQSTVGFIPIANPLRWSVHNTAGSRQPGASPTPSSRLMAASTSGCLCAVQLQKIAPRSIPSPMAHRRRAESSFSCTPELQMRTARPAHRFWWDCFATS